MRLFQQIDKFDGLPNMLCTKCAYRTQVLYNFKLKVQESDKKFRMMLKNQTNVPIKVIGNIIVGKNIILI